jgi:hypothetical protein
VTTKSGRARPRCTLVSLFAAALLVACGGKGAGTGSGQVVGGGSCDATAQKQFVLNTAREWYLFPELLPASIDPSTYADATSFLDALTATARAQGRDRSFSYVTSIAAEQALLSGGESAGFGISLLIDEPARRVFVGQVFESSAAADAGLARGDEILAVGTSAATLQPVATLLATPNGLTEAIGPSTAGTVRTLRWRNLAGQEFTREIIKRTFSIVPVPPAQVRLNQHGRCRIAQRLPDIPQQRRSRPDRRPALQRRRTGQHCRAAAEPAGRRSHEPGVVRDPIQPGQGI